MGRKSRAVEDYFHHIDTPLKAYLLGLLAADGNVHVDAKRHAYKISLKLHSDDELLVARMRDELAPTVQLNYPGNQCRFEVCSRQMMQDLAHFGIVPRKTWILPWPSALPEAMAMPFLLGYFDGDGSLGVYKARPEKGMHEPYLQWTIIGHYDFLLDVRERILCWCGVELAPPRLSSAQTSFLYRITTSGEKAEAVDRILNLSGLGLPRKHLPGVWDGYKARMNARQNKDRSSE